MARKLTTKLRYRAALAVLLLALGWLATPLTVAAQEPDVCGMACCIEDGYCCCVVRHAYVEGQEPEPGEVTLNLPSTLTAPCSSGCVSSIPSAPIGWLRTATISAPTILLTTHELRFDREQEIIHHPFTTQPSAPRAPPARA